MSEISIQIRRVTEKVKQYYSIFGLRPYARMRPGRSVIRGSKRLGFDEIECVVAETARGTSVGFYAINQLQSLLHSLPFILLLLITGLTQVEQISPYLLGTSEGFVALNFVKLIGGNASINFPFVLFMIFLMVTFSITDIMIQRIRLEIIKSRFSFFSRDGIWETRDVPLSLIALQAIRSVFIHVWILAIVYFAAFSSTGNVVFELTQLYGADEPALVNATIDAFVITGGLVLGTLTSYKAITLRKYYGRVDSSSRISGGLTERRIDPILFGVQSALIAGVLMSLFLSVTFLTTASSGQFGQFLFFTLLGGAIAGAIHEEGHLWVLSSYAVYIFFTSLMLIFRTGSEPAYAYIVVLQLFFIPIPFLMILSQNISSVLKKSGLNNPEWYFDTLPIFTFLAMYLKMRQEKQAKRIYEDSLEDEISTEVLEDKIKIRKDILENTSSNAYKMVRHYFELLFTYTASFEDSQFITLPTFYQLNQWWSSKTGDQMDDTEFEFVSTTDQLLWDPDYSPKDPELSKYEEAGRNMVLSIQ